MVPRSGGNRIVVVILCCYCLKAFAGGSDYPLLPADKYDLNTPRNIDPLQILMVLNSQQCRLADLLSFYRSKLGIKSTTTLHLVAMKMPDAQIQGFTRKLEEPDHYLVALSYGLDPGELRVTLAHELVHVLQIEEKRIDATEFHRDYLMRSFEDEAFRTSLPLAAEFYTRHDCQRHGENKSDQYKNMSLTVNDQFFP
ncbi:hypothetical protein CI610_01594 [invertebrate metagenome]|uniref:DUF4157 domain-containing protein n=1 Tax=invertebrate metagenome TaxID=1711999 RepID=A0A2H9T863_9ZZZZ